MTVTLRLTLTLKLKGDLDILKMYPHTENEAASLWISKLRAWVQKNIKAQKLKITSNIYIYIYIPIKPQQFPTSSFWVAHHNFFAHVSGVEF